GVVVGDGAGGDGEGVGAGKGGGAHGRGLLWITGDPARGWWMSRSGSRAGARSSWAVAITARAALLFAGSAAARTRWLRAGGGAGPAGGGWGGEARGAGAAGPGGEGGGGGGRSGERKRSTTGGVGVRRLARVRALVSRASLTITDGAAGSALRRRARRARRI